MITCIFCTDFHTISPRSVYEFVGKILKLAFAAAHKIDVVGESKVAYGSATNENRCVVVMECLLHEDIEEQVEQDGRK